MKQVVLQIRENEYEFVLKLLSQLQSVKVIEAPESVRISGEKMEMLKSIKQGLEEVRQIQQGQLPKKTLEEFLAEID